MDESGFNTSMTRLRARAPRGKRAYGKVPRNRGKNTTLIAAITLEGAMGESMTVEGATDAAEAFEAYVLSTFLRLRFVRGRWWWCSIGWGRTGQREGQRIRASQRSRSRVLALLLLAGSEPHRGSFQ